MTSCSFNNASTGTWCLRLKCDTQMPGQSISYVQFILLTGFTLRFKVSKGYDKWTSKLCRSRKINDTKYAGPSYDSIC